MEATNYFVDTIDIRKVICFINFFKKVSKLKKIFDKSIKSINPIYINQLISIIPRKYQYKAAGDRLHKLADVITYSNDFEFYKFLISSFKSPKDYLISGKKLIYFPNHIIGQILQIFEN